MATDSTSRYIKTFLFTRFVGSLLKCRCEWDQIYSRIIKNSEQVNFYSGYTQNLLQNSKPSSYMLNSYKKNSKYVWEWCKCKGLCLNINTICLSLPLSLSLTIHPSIHMNTCMYVFPNMLMAKHWTSVWNHANLYSSRNFYVWESQGFFSKGTFL